METYPADTRESDPSTTPPSNSMAIMVVCKQWHTMTAAVFRINSDKPAAVISAFVPRGQQLCSAVTAHHVRKNIKENSVLTPVFTSSESHSGPVSSNMMMLWTAETPVTTHGQLWVEVTPNVNRNLQSSSSGVILLFKVLKTSREALSLFAVGLIHQKQFYSQVLGGRHVFLNKLETES